MWSLPRLLVIVALLIGQLELACSFTPPTSSVATTKTTAKMLGPLFAEESNKKKKGGLEENVRTRLLSESIAPWRSLRLFLYGALGSGAFIGGLITLTGFAAIVSGAKEGDIKTEALNLGIDFGAVAVFAALFKWDLDKQKELDEKVNQKLERKKEQKQITKSMEDRQRNLASLSLDVQVSADGTAQTATVRELQAGARQHMIIVVGPRKACRDALIGANLLKMDFAMSNVLVVPYETGKKQPRPEGGFGELPTYETQPYVARPSGDGWEEYIEAELNDAKAQNGDKVLEEGIAIVVSSNGKVIRRGVGKVPWRQMVEQLEESVGKGPPKEPSLF